MMKALIRRYPDTPTKPVQDEIMTEPWPPFVKEDGAPLTDPLFGYAYCEDCPPDAELGDFVIEEKDGKLIARYVGESA